MTAARTNDGTTTAGGTALDRRRAKLQETRAGVEAAGQAVSRLDEQLDGNATKHREHEGALQAALDQVASLKKAIKSVEKESGRLQTGRKRAGRKAAEAGQRAASAEAKYDRAVLADMLRREKDRDLSAHSPADLHRGREAAAGNVAATDESDGSAADVAGGDVTAAGTTPRQDTESPTDTPETESAGTESAETESDSARRTAARSTASRARSTSARSTRAPAQQAGSDGPSSTAEDATST